jgi:hypothetical protein
LGSQEIVGSRRILSPAEINSVSRAFDEFAELLIFKRAAD